MNNDAKQKIIKNKPSKSDGRENDLERTPLQRTTTFTIASIPTQKFPKHQKLNTIWISAFFTICCITETVSAGKNTTLPL